jgi:hypothetical protein
LHQPSAIKKGSNNMGTATTLSTTRTALTLGALALTLLTTGAGSVLASTPVQARPRVQRDHDQETHTKGKKRGKNQRTVSGSIPIMGMIGTRFIIPLA